MEALSLSTDASSLCQVDIKIARTATEKIKVWHTPWNCIQLHTDELQKHRQENQNVYY